MPRSRSIAQILLRGALRRAGRVFKTGIPGSTVTYAYTSDSLDAGYSVLTPSNAVLTRALTRDPLRRSLITVVSNYVTRADGDPENLSPLPSNLSPPSFVYTYDALGRPVVRNLDEFGYNARGEVAWARYGTNTLADIYDYDFIGNFTSNRLRGAWSQFEANELNEYAAIADGNPRSLAYDLDGNLLTNGVWSYTYDSLNRLSVVCSNNLVVTENAYDPFYRRVFRSEANGEHGYLYDDWNPIRETVSTTEIETSVENYWGKDLSGTLQGAGGVGGLLAIERLDVFFFPSYDNLGNVIAYSDRNGVPVANYFYDAFGSVSFSFGQLAHIFSHLFSTKPVDTNSDLVFYGFRHFSTKICRWISRDPVEEKSGLNILVGMFNNVLWNMDYLGLKNLSLYYFLTDYKINDNEENEKVNFWLFWHKSYTAKSAEELLKDIKAKIEEEKKTDACACVSDLHIFGHGDSGSFNWFSYFDDEDNSYEFTNETIEHGKQFYERMHGPLQNSTTLDVLQKYELDMYEFLLQLSSFLCEKSTFEVLSCKVGAGSNGKQLQELLDAIFPNTTVILPKTIVTWRSGLYSYGMKEEGKTKKAKRNPSQKKR